MSSKDDLSTNNNQPKRVVFDSKRLNYEEERLKTFASWPVHYPVDPPRLAKAGFYYTGNEDEVVCFSCQGHIKNWNYGDIVLKKHTDLYPNCDFIRNVSNNIPLSKNFVVPEPCNTKRCSDEMQFDFDFDYEKMKSENERMKTFTEGWPLSNASIADIAHAGYFYTGAIDRVQCAFCKVIVGNLKATTAPYSKCLWHLPWCDHLSDKSRNCTTKVKNKMVPWYKFSSQDVCGSTKLTDSSSGSISLANKLNSNNQQQVNLEDLGVYLHKSPVYPNYASLRKRLGTFSSWPTNAPVSKEDLAVAGFFHLGVDDRTVCFYCNGGLKSWEAGDDPWVEHAQWFSSCDFLRLNKGSDFIIDCLLKSISALLNENQDVSCESEVSESLLKKLDEALKSNLVRNLTESGIFPSYVLKAAILLQIKQTGSSFSNYDDLCVAASYLKDKMEQLYSNEKSVKVEDLNIKLSKHSTISDANEEPNKIEQMPSHSCNTSDEKNLNKGKSVASGEINLQKEDQSLCKICMEKELGVVFLPCGHLPACTMCAPELKHCPLCRKPIQATVRCYFQ